MKRQGDLLIRKIKELPEQAKKRQGRILAEGEATGHKHELDLDGILYEKGGTLYFSVPESKTATLTHNEHGPLTFEEGTYKVVRQREYTPKKWRQVSD